MPNYWHFFFREIVSRMMHIRDLFRYYLIKSKRICDVYMSTQNVFIFWVSPLFYEAVAGFLKHPKINLVGSTSNYAALSSDIVRTKPNIILIENTDKPHSEMIREYLDSIPWTFKIILLGFNDNNINVYHHEHRSMVSMDDLLQLILDEL